MTLQDLTESALRGSRLEGFSLLPALEQDEVRLRSEAASLTIEYDWKDRILITRYRPAADAERIDTVLSFETLALRDASFALDRIAEKNGCADVRFCADIDLSDEAGSVKTIEALLNRLACIPDLASGKYFEDESLRHKPQPLRIYEP